MSAKRPRPPLIDEDAEGVDFFAPAPARGRARVSRQQLSERPSAASVYRTLGEDEVASTAEQAYVKSLVDLHWPHWAWLLRSALPASASPSP